MFPIEALVLRLSHSRMLLARFAAFTALFVVCIVAATAAQDDANEPPLGDVARTLRKKSSGSQQVIDNDNFSTVMNQVESRHAPGSALKYLMSGDNKGFQVSGPDATCSLSFSANAKALLSTQYAQMELSPTDVGKLDGPATIEGDALTVSVLNRTNWHVSEVTVALTILKKGTLADSVGDVPPTVAPTQAVSYGPDEVRPEKKPDRTVIYRMRAAAPPQTTTVFSTPLNLDLSPGDEWHWAIVQARGYPPESRMDGGQLEKAQVEKNSSAGTQALFPVPGPSPVEEIPLTPSPVSLADPQ